MIGNNTGKEKLDEVNKDRTTGEENNIEVLVVAEQTPMSLGVKQKKRHRRRCIQHIIVEHRNRRISMIFK